MKKVNKFIALLLAVLMCASIAACTPGGGTNQASSPAPASSQASAPAAQSSQPANKQVELTHWVWVDNPDYAAVVKDMAKKFTEKNPNIKVNVEVVAWADYYNNLLNAVMGGGGPDTAAFKITWTPAFTASGKLLALDDYVSKWDKKSDIIPSLWNTMKPVKDGKTYAMPWMWQVLYVYYRPSLFKKAGIQNPPTTIEEFLEACKKQTMDTNGDGKIDVYGFGMRGARGGHEPWGSFIQAYGGSFTNDKGEVNLNTPEKAKGMQAFIDLYKKGYTPKTAPTDGFNEIIAGFKSGLTAMTVHHISSYKGMVDTFKDDVDAFPFPKGPGGQWTSMGDTENVIFSKTKNPEEAFKWVSFLATAEQSDQWSRATGNVPVCNSVFNQDFYKNNKFMKVSAAGAPSAGVYPILPTMGEWTESVWPSTIQQALQGQITAEQAMKILDEKLKGAK